MKYQRKEIKNKFSEKFKEYLEKNGYSQNSFAKAHDLPQSTVNGWCTGDFQPSLDTLLWLCLVINKDINEMTGYDDLR